MIAIEGSAGRTLMYCDSYFSLGFFSLFELCKDVGRIVENMMRVVVNCSRPQPRHDVNDLLRCNKGVVGCGKMLDINWLRMRTCRIII